MKLLLKYFKKQFRNLFDKFKDKNLQGNGIELYLKHNVGKSVIQIQSNFKRLDQQINGSYNKECIY